MDTKHVPSLKAFNRQKMQKVHLFSDKIYYVLEGQGTFHIGGESQELQEHMIVMAPSEVEHGVVNTSNTRLVLLVYMAPKP